jgi:hypothetical protein
LLCKLGYIVDSSYLPLFFLLGFPVSVASWDCIDPIVSSSLRWQKRCYVIRSAASPYSCLSLSMAEEMTTRKHTFCQPAVMVATCIAPLNIASGRLSSSEEGIMVRLAMNYATTSLHENPSRVDYTEHVDAGV